jgi:hypothetical protein
MTNSLRRSTIMLGVLAGSLALVLLSLALATHGSQGMFQLNRPAAEYSALLLNRAAPLRIDLAVDFIYICVYAAFFVKLASVLPALRQQTGNEHAPSVSSAVWVSALLATALLDALENTHILAMLSSAEHGVPIPQDAIVWQAVESQMKFLFSYFGLFLLSFYVPAESLFERGFAFVLRWVQAPVGIAIFVLPLEAAKPFYLARALFFILGFWSMAWIVHRRSMPDSLAHAPAAIGSGA